MRMEDPALPVLALRKGAWTPVEDELLRNCIQRHGEGKWHKVPSRAGLNRCRKSCRLRWLNYLKPDIKRGEFTSDEIDLMVRLHKLLGNRLDLLGVQGKASWLRFSSLEWSLIAGRLPGRTANDVKNFWNTHMRKKQKTYNPYSEEDDLKGKTVKTITSTKNEIVKPRPFKLSKNICLFIGTVQDKDHRGHSDNHLGKTSMPVEFPPSCTKEDKETNKSNTINPLAGKSVSTLFEEESSSKENDWWSNLSNEEEIWNLFFNEGQ